MVAKQDARVLVRLLLTAVVVTSLTACNSGESTDSSAAPPGEASAAGASDGVKEQLSGTIPIDGSSTVFPITEAMAEEFQGGHPDVRVTVGISGTGGGFKKFCNGETDISNASRPIKESERIACDEAGIEYIELPVAYDAISVVVSPSNHWVGCLTVEELATAWHPDAQGKLSNWNQVRSEFPDQGLNLYGPGTDSGTFDYFTDAIVGDEGASRGDYTASEDDNVIVQGVANDVGGLGYFGLAYYEENQGRVKALGIDDGDAANGNGCIEPSTATVENGTYQPLARPIFIYVKKSAVEEKPEVQAFVEFYLNAQNRGLVAEVGYVAIGDSLYEKTRARLNERKIGTAFPEGSTVGVKLTDVL
ncbi:phosphate binding protein [Rubidibacter lacunae KORDI 51-2]|uniref:Phosphate-binding protein n=2 Tax=Rubidibacter TaxID=582491 RepID=U5DH12_9CHRO|nr:phosphate binding protein [Rubidibacter lacunae KORDI 51-2]